MTTTPPSEPLGRGALPQERSPGEGYRGRKLVGADLSGAALGGLSFIQADLRGASLQGAILSATLFHGARLRGADLTGVTADALGAHEADMEGVLLKDAVLKGAQLIGVVLLDADLRGADLTGADLRGADLRYTNFTGADLSGANLSRCDLEGARLSGAVLTDARVAGARIAKISGLSPDQLQDLLNRGAYSGFLPRLSDRLQQLGRQIWEVLQSRPELAERPPESAPASDARAEAEPSGSSGVAVLYSDFQQRTLAPQETFQRRRGRAEVERREQEKAWRSKQQQAQEERRYRRENREEWRKKHEQRRRIALERIRAVRQERRRLRALEDKTASRTSLVLRRAQQQERARMEALVLEDAPHQERVEAAQQASAREPSQFQLALDQDKARARASAVRTAQAEVSARLARLESVLEPLDATLVEKDDALQELQLLLRQTSRQQARLEQRGLLLTRQQREMTRSGVDTTAVKAEVAALEQELFAVVASCQALADQMASLQSLRAQVLTRQEDTIAAIAQCRADAAQLEEEASRADADASLLERQRTRLSATSAAPPSTNRRMFDRVWYAFTDRIAENHPHFAVQLDQLRQRTLRLSRFLQQRAEGSPADLLRAAKRRQERSQQRVAFRAALLQASDEQRAAEERMKVALRHSRTTSDERSLIPSQEASGLLAQLLDRLWYNLTDLLSVASLDVAERLDRAKERLEWELVSRRYAARRARAVQEQESEIVLRQQRLQDQDQRLARLIRIREREEQRAQKRAAQEARQLAVEVEQQRRAAIRARSPSDRHACVRERYAALTDHMGINHRGADLRGKRLREVEWSDADLRGARLDAARLDNADLIAARIEGASLEGTRLNGATLDGAVLQDARMAGVRLRQASLLGAQLRNALLSDADLRGADLTGTDLSGADLTGADLRKASLFGANLTGANLTSARLNGVELNGVVLDQAVLDQADLSGVQWDGASVDGADLSGALGLSSIQREQLRDRGAEAGDLVLDELFSRLGARQVRLLSAVAVVATAIVLVTNYLMPDSSETATLEAEASALRETDPLAAAERYLTLAEEAPRLEDRVGYLVEAALMLETGGDDTGATTLYGRALEVAGDDQALAAQLQMRRATFALEQGSYAAAARDAAAAMAVSGQPAEQRARAILLFERSSAAAGESPSASLQALFDSLSDVADASGQIHIALAELRSSRGDISSALAELDTAATLDLPSDLVLQMLETRARVLDRAGDLAGSAQVLQTLMADTDSAALTYQTASLQLADIRQRQGDTAAALRIIENLGGVELDPQLQGRAMLVTGRIYESADRTDDAARTYQTLLSQASLEVNVQEEARVGLARLLLSENGDALVDGMLLEQPADFTQQVMAQAQLGDARRLLDEGDPSAALGLYDAVLSEGGLSDELIRAAQASRGEALASLGLMAEAEGVWRTLVADGALSATEKVYLELLLANGLLQSGRQEEAETAFISLASATDPEIRSQGRLGLAEVARAAGERERARSLLQQVADEAVDPAWQVQARLELADLAVEEGAMENAQAAWRVVLGLVPASDPAAIRARLSLVESFADAGNADDATRLCQEAIASATGPEARQGARQACAEALERSGLQEAALEAYTQQQREAGLSDEAFSEASLGIARILLDADPRASLTASRAGLERCDDLATRLQLITFQLQAATAVGDDAALSAAESARTELAAASPQLAARLLIESASAAHEAGQSDDALAMLDQAAALELPPLEEASVALERGHILVSIGDLEAARMPLERALGADDPQLVFAAGMGLADIELRRGDPRAAIRRYDSLKAPDPGAEQWLLEVRARALTQAGDPAALDNWAELADRSGDPSLKSISLQGQADTLLSQERFDEAIEMYAAAADAAIEPAAAGWSQLGSAEAMRLTGDLEAARSVLAELVAHPDTEVSMQAAIQQAQLELSTDRPEAALAALRGRETKALGPGWDATVSEIRASAMVTLGRTSAAEAELEALAIRWPDEEEAELPAWLGLADLARDSGALDEAREWAGLALNSARDPVYRDRALDLFEQLDAQ